MDYNEHFAAAEKALEGAKEQIKMCDALQSPSDSRQLMALQVSAGLLLNVAAVHGRLAGIALAIDTRPREWQGGPR